MKDHSAMLSILIPTKNDGSTLEPLLERLYAALPHAETWIIDGGQDDTEILSRPWKKRWPDVHYFRNVGDRGKGHAIRLGLAKCTRPFIAQLDADLQFHPEDLVPMLEKCIDRQADFICGSRFLATSQRGVDSTPALRRVGNHVFSFYTTLMTGQAFSDVLAGIKLWKREVTETFTLTADDYTYEVELPIKAKRRGFRVVDFPVSTEARAHGQSSVNVFKTSLALLKNIPKFQWQKIS